MLLKFMGIPLAALSCLFVLAAAAAEGDAPPDNSAPTGLARGSLNPAKRGVAIAPSGNVMVIPINDAESTKYGMIDDWQAGFVERRLRRAADEKFDLVILEIDTNGGSVAAFESINKAIETCPVPVVAFVKGKAFSGGAIISLGSKAIVMAPGSQIGGAKAVSLFGDLSPDMKQKVDSMMRAMVSNLCDANKYPCAIAEGMVNSDVEVHELTDPNNRFVNGEQLEQMEKSLTVKPVVVRKWKGKDQILTLTAREAVNAGLASGIAVDAEEVMTGMNIAAKTFERAEVTTAERVSRFVSHPIWAVIMVLVGLVALFWELKSPGHGVGYILFAFCMGLFFWQQVFAQNAGLIEICCFGIGAVMVAVEIFILPGFGAAGFAGIGLILASIVLAFLPESVSLSNVFRGKVSPWEMERVTAGLKWASMTLVAIVAVVITGLIKGARLPGISRLALQTQVGTPAMAGAGGAAALAAPPLSALVGQHGAAETVLRPAGKVRLGGVTYDAVSEGSFLEPGAAVVVMRVTGNGLVVRAL